ncbi:MAG: hypothetical protein ACREYD_04510 [Casimicrobiaceae bacterium]
MDLALREPGAFIVFSRVGAAVRESGAEQQLVGISACATSEALIPGWYVSRFFVTFSIADQRARRSAPNRAFFEQ